MNHVPEAPMDERDTGRESMAAASADDPPHAEPAAPKRRRHWGWILFGVFVVLPILGFALWTTIALNWSYSVGQRAGFIQKFSEKGWVCKTWEGELVMANPLPGALQEKFQFTVRDDSVAHQIQRLMGSRVAITYEEHRGIPSHCFGDTRYFVTRVSPTS
jgi:ABC-type phosphate/phosphonate transport system permease subunit